MRIVPPKIKRYPINTTVQQGYVACKGGYNTVQAVIMNDPGYVSAAQNFEVSQYGGYRRIKGYERYDGRAAPSAATYSRAPVTFTGAVVAGDTVTGVTSATTAKVLAVEGDALILTALSDAFDDGEVLNVMGAPVATLVLNATENGASTSYLNAYYKSLAANHYRALITAVPGSGPVRGVQWYDDNVYAFRNDAPGTACAMYVSSSSGWALVDLGKQVSYTVGNAVAVGDTLTQGGVTALVTGITLESGAMTGTGSGRLTLATVTGGNFVAGAATTTSGTCTLSGAEAAITLAPGGKFSLDNYAFANTVKMYGCDGVNPEFEFDGTTFIPLNTGSTTKALFIVGHANHLIMLAGSSLLISGIGEPYNYEVIKGAAEISVGATGTGILKQPGTDTVSSLVVYTRDSSHILYGTSASDFSLVSYQQGVGAFPYSAQNIGTAYSMDERGVIRIGASQNYGNFEHASISRLYTEYLTLRTVSTSSVWRNGNQYRIFFTDGSGIYITMNGQETMGAMPISFPVVMNCSTVADTSDGERTWLGGNDGYVYKLDSGASFDGAPIEFFLTFPDWSAKSPLTRKTWKRGRFDASFTGYARFSLQPSVAYGSAYSIQPDSVSIIKEGGVTVTWDNAEWDAGRWDSFASQPAPVEFELAGVGEALSMTIYGNSALVDQFTLHGFLANYILRRAER